MPIRLAAGVVSEACTVAGVVSKAWTVAGVVSEARLVAASELLLGEAIGVIDSCWSPVAVEVTVGLAVSS